MAAAVAVVGKRGAHLPQENPGEGGKEQVPHADLRGQYEEEIAEDAAHRQPQQIEQGDRRRQLPEQVVEHRQQHHDKQPDARQKHRQDQWHAQGRKRGIEVEMFPRLGHEDLHRLVHRGAERHQQAEQQRIDAVDIIKVDHLQLLAAEQPEQPYAREQGEDNDEIRSMRVAEQVDELRDAVRRHEGALHLPLTDPSLHLLRVGQFHPYTVHAVRRMEGDFGHDHPVAPPERVVTVLHRKAGNHDGVRHHLQVRVQRIVACVEAGERIARRGTHRLLVEPRASVSAREKNEADEQENTGECAAAQGQRTARPVPLRTRFHFPTMSNLLILHELSSYLVQVFILSGITSCPIPHIPSFGNFRNRTPGGSAARHSPTDNKVPCRATSPSDGQDTTP